MTLAEAPDRLQHVIDVRHHGAFFAGGSAAENAATLTAAITAASTAPVKAAVKLPSGLFNVDNSSVIVLPQNVGLTGDGVLYGGNTRGTILNGTDDTKEVIRLGSANSSGQTYKEGFVLENLRITGGLYGIACRNGVAHLDMHRVEIASQADNGAAVRVDGWLEKVRAEHCWFYGPTGGYGWYNANVTAQNGTRYLDKTSFYDCHFLGGTNTARFMGQMDAVLFVGCAFNSSTSHGIVIDGNTTQVNFLNCSSEAVGQGAKSNRTTGTISSGLASLVLASATGYAQGDSVVVKGAGANGVDLFATISTLVGTTATLDTTASTSVTAAYVTNATVDVVSLQNSIHTPGNINFFGCWLAGEGTGGHQRYAVDARTAEHIGFAFCVANDAIPVYDPEGKCTVLGGQILLRQPSTLVGHQITLPTFANFGTTTGQVPERAVLTSPPGKNLILDLVDSAGNGGGTLGLLEVRITDGNKTRPFYIDPTNTLVVFDRTNYTVQHKGRVLIDAKANPATCTKGEINVGTDGKLYVCSSTDTWTVAGSQS